MYLYNNIKITGAWKHADGRSIPRGWVDGATPEQLIEYGVEAVAEPIIPTYDTATQRLSTLPSGQYEVINLTQEQIDAKKVQSVSMRQARLALLQAGYLGNVATIIASLPAEQKQAAEIEWEYATDVRRDSILTLLLADGVGLTSAQVDNLFKLASEIV
tara:strand:+ start:13994 stop:14470 length:477 start_codon:yes stop_codon:yes gene_type:complete